jgi:hypothetical protein
MPRDSSKKKNDLSAQPLISKASDSNLYGTTSNDEFQVTNPAAVSVVSIDTANSESEADGSVNSVGKKPKEEAADSALNDQQRVEGQSDSASVTGAGETVTVTEKPKLTTVYFCKDEASSAVSDSAADDQQHVEAHSDSASVTGADETATVTEKPKLTTADFCKDAASYTFRRLIPMAAVSVFASAVDFTDNEQRATAILMLVSVLLTLLRDMADLTCRTSPLVSDSFIAKQEQLIETIAALKMCVGVVLMGRGFIQEYYPTKSEEVGSTAMGLFAVFALVSLINNILKLTGHIDKNGKPSVEAMASFSGLTGSILFLVKQVMDHMSATEESKLEFSKKFIVVSSGFTLSTLYHFVVSMMKWCQPENEVAADNVTVVSGASSGGSAVSLPTIVTASAAAAAAAGGGSIGYIGIPRPGHSSVGFLLHAQKKGEEAAAASGSKKRVDTPRPSAANFFAGSEQESLGETLVPPNPPSGDSSIEDCYTIAKSKIFYD